MCYKAMVFRKYVSKKLACFFKKSKRRNKVNENKCRKLHLVLDLDHTLVHSILVSQLSEKEKYLTEEADSREDLWRFNKGHSSEFFIKLRPFVREFLQEANKLFSLSVYTMGSYDYAHTVLDLIDPEKVYFGDRVITREKSPYKKTLNLVKADKRRVVIVDDTRHVWPDHQRNLLKITRYIYFRADNDSKVSYAEQKRDESQSNGSLANLLKFLKTLHKTFQEDLDLNDLRLLLPDPFNCRHCCF